MVSVASGRICSLVALHGSDLWIGLAGGRIAVVDGAVHDAPPDDPIHFRLLKEWKYVPPQPPPQLGREHDLSQLGPRVRGERSVGAAAEGVGGEVFAGGEFMQL